MIMVIKNLYTYIYIPSKRPKTCIFPHPSKHSKSYSYSPMNIQKYSIYSIACCSKWGIRQRHLILILMQPVVLNVFEAIAAECISVSFTIHPPARTCNILAFREHKERIQYHLQWARTYWEISRISLCKLSSRRRRKLSFSNSAYFDSGGCNYMQRRVKLDKITLKNSQADRHNSILATVK